MIESRESREWTKYVCVYIWVVVRGVGFTHCLVMFTSIQLFTTLTVTSAEWPAVKCIKWIVLYGSRYTW